MGLAKKALQIDLRNMSYVHIAEDGKSAKVGGGATVKQLVDALEKAGKRTGAYSFHLKHDSLCAVLGK